MSAHQNDFISNSSFPDFKGELNGNYFQNNTNKFPILVPSGENDYQYSSKKKRNNKESKKKAEKNNKTTNYEYYNNIISNETENGMEKNSSRKLQTDNNEYSNESLKKSENIELIIDKQNKNNKNDLENEEENIDKESEIELKKQEKLNNDYNKYEINANKGEGNNTNISQNLLPSKCVLILRIILYNFIRPIYLYLFIVGILLCIPDYSDLPIIISLIIYIIMICTSIIIEIMEEIKAQNKNIFFDENIKYQKIIDNNILNVPIKNIQNGDIIVVKNGDVCPSDMIIVDSSINKIPLFFGSENLTGTFNFNVRLIKNNILKKFKKIKNEFEQKFCEYIKKLEEKEIEKMIEQQQKMKQSKIIYKEFLERNGLINEQEEDIKKEEEKQNIIKDFRFDPNNKIYEELKNQEYYKSISNNLFKGYYYIPKDSNNSLYYLNLFFKGEEDAEVNRIFEINSKNMCYCGEKFKNAMWVIGIVVHTGKDVKPLREINEEFNSFSNYFRRRKTVFEDEINYYFYILLTISFFLSIIAGIVNMVYVDSFSYILYNDIDKNRHPKNPAKNFYHALLDYICLMHSIIPYTVFFTIEIVLLFQKLYINSDIDLFNKNGEIISDSKQIKDLGKVDLILTDKTGKKKKNERYFKYCVIADGCYEYRNDGKKSSLNALNKNYAKALTFSDYDMINSSSYRKGNGIIDSVQYDGYIVRSIQNFNKCIYLDRTEKLIEEFWKAISLCHDALPVFQKSNLYGEYYLNGKNNKEQKYFSNSEDNITFVEMASRQGFTFFMDEKNTSLYMGDGTPTKENNQFYNLINCDCEIILGEPGPDFEKISIPIKKLCHLKFHSQRKRESVIVKEGDYIKLFVKGPIDEILPRIIDTYTPKQLIYSSKNWLKTVQSTGCRGFVVGMRILTSNEYNVFINCFREANNDVYDTKIRVNKVIDALESNLTLLGGIFIEDVLPKRIRDVISNIKNAGIKIWMVTGDKVSSSFNVGLSTGIIDKNNEIIIAEINQELLLEKENKKRNLKNKSLNNINKRIENVDEQKDAQKMEINEEIEPKIKDKNIEKQIKDVLKSFNDEFKKMQKNSSLINKANKYDIVIDSLSFREISKTPQNIKAFFDKAILANSLTFCDFNSNDKKMLVKNIRNYIKGIKNINSYTIMGIGDGFNDIEMLKEVDIGVGINNGINKYTKINVDNFSDLSRLIMFHGINNLKRNSGIVELLLVRHFMFGFIFFIYGCHCCFSNVYIIPTKDIYLSIFILNLFGPFLKGIFDLNVFYFYDKKEKIENKNIENESNHSEHNEDDKKNTNQDENNDYIREKIEKKERIKNRMLKNIYDNSFKYIYFQKNIDLVESGSEHIPYKKYISINKFIFLIIKAIIFCFINFYLTYGTIDAGHNIIDLSGNMIDFRRLQIVLWSNHSFIIFLENEIFTSFYTIFRIIEIVLYLCLYLVIFFVYQKNNTEQANPLNSFLLFLNFLLIVSFCCFVNFGVFIIQNLFDNTIIYKLKYMKISDNYLEEMKILVNYKEGKDEEDEDGENQKQLEKEKSNILEVENQIVRDDFNNEDYFNMGPKEISAIKNDDNENNNFNNNFNENITNNTNSKIIINRKNKNNNKNQDNNELQSSQQLFDNFNKNPIRKKEIKKSEMQDSIYLMNLTRFKNKEKEKDNKNDLKYVVEKNLKNNYKK